MEYGKCKMEIKMFISRVPGGSQTNNHIKHFSFAVHWVSTNPIRFWLGLVRQPRTRPSNSLESNPENTRKTHTYTHKHKWSAEKSLHTLQQKMFSSQFACHNCWLKFCFRLLVWVSGSFHVCQCVYLAGICVSLENLTCGPQVGSQLVWHT